MASNYKVVKMNIGFGECVYTVNRVCGIDLVPVRPYKEYKTEAGALRDIKKRCGELIK